VSNENVTRLEMLVGAPWKRGDNVVEHVDTAVSKQGAIATNIGVTTLSNEGLLHCDRCSLVLLDTTMV